MTHDEIKEYLTEHGHEDALIFENPDFDSAFAGVTHDGRALYDWNKMVESLQDEGMTDEEAIEFIDYNTLRSLPYYGDKAPVVFYPVEM